MTEPRTPVHQGSGAKSEQAVEVRRTGDSPSLERVKDLEFPSSKSANSLPSPLLSVDDDLRLVRSRSADEPPSDAHRSPGSPRRKDGGRTSGDPENKSPSRVHDSPGAHSRTLQHALSVHGGSPGLRPPSTSSAMRSPSPLRLTSTKRAPPDEEFSRFLLNKGFQAHVLERVAENLSDFSKNLVMQQTAEKTFKEPKTLMEGWLHRQSGRSMKKLFCVVECGNFKYFANEGDDKPKGILPLSLAESSTCKEHEVLGSTFILGTGNGKKREETQWVAPYEDSAKWVACITVAITGFPDQGIGDDHHCHELTLDMMHGIRTMIGKNSHKDSAFLLPTDKDFAEVVSQEFPSKGSKFTPPHKMGDFGFKDYCPTVFRRIRARYGIQPSDYILDVCGNFGYLQFVSNSKSGEFFFHSHNRKYMIKTISHNECRCLRMHMSTYYRHMMANPSTLLNKFLGLHKVKPRGTRCCWFLIMGSVFPSTLPMHLMFDLKGATRHRSVKPSDQGKPTTVYKDNDFVSQKITLDVGVLAEPLMTQISKDLKLLEVMRIIDYSILLGIHFINRNPEAKTEENPNARPEVDAARQEDVDRAARFQVALLRLSGFLQDMTPEALLSMTEDDFEAAAGAPEGRLFYAALHGSSPAPVLASKRTDSQVPAHVPGTPRSGESKADFAAELVPSVFTTDRGGIRAVVGPKGEEAILFLGIIDTLIEFGSKKKIESFYKSNILRCDKKSFSVVEPEYYAERLTTFVQSKIVGGPASPTSV